ncbi:diacylglycerol kinase family lipid kinase [Phormidium tenue FACHB-886]|nr:diacylglycerol kinase family lipid kinase [Phormidium tenue FACHB-886]
MHPESYEKPNSQHALLIMNPTAGDDEPNPMKLPEIVEALEAEGIRAELTFTKPEESPALIAEQAVREGYDLVIVGGGDGTVSEVAKGLLYAPIPLGIIPIGTYNNIARSLNLPNSVSEACQVITHGQIKAIDVGQANDQHYFFEAAGVGLDAVLFPLGEEIKGGRWERMIQAVRLAMNYAPQPLMIQLDHIVAQARPQSARLPRFRQRQQLSHRELSRLAMLVVIANAPYYGTGFTVAPEAIIDDGLLTISIFRNFSKWELLRHFWSISRGQYHYSPKIETYNAAEATLNSNVKLPVHLDGHIIGTLPVTLKVCRHALKVIVPSLSTPVYQVQSDPNPPVALPATGSDKTLSS